MKKIILCTLIIVFLGSSALLAIMPGAPRQGECLKFHPHANEFGGGEAVLKLLDWLVLTGNFNAWTEFSGRTVVTFSTSMGKPGFIAYGQGNPSMFIPSGGIDYIRNQTKDMKKITSIDGLNAVKNTLQNCLRSSYALSLAAAAAAVPVSQQLLKNLMLGSGAALLLLVVGFFFLGGSKSRSLTA